jgi:hypothetical protein
VTYPSLSFFAQSVHCKYFKSGLLAQSIQYKYFIGKVFILPYLGRLNGKARLGGRAFSVFVLCFYYNGLTITKNRFPDKFYVLMGLRLGAFLIVWGLDSFRVRLRWQLEKGPGRGIGPVDPVAGSRNKL